MTEEDAAKPTCFVMQTFDGGKYDRRYSETIKPALDRAGVEPQRADQMLGLTPVIEKIESAIKAATICVADVSEDNPNVWLELGYALALDRPTVILCDKAARPRLPFDIQHRPVIFYRTDSRSGYEELESNIIKWVTNELKTAKRLSRTPVLRPGSEVKSDLEDYEISALSICFEFWPTTMGGASHWDIDKKMKSLGFADIAIALGVAGLVEKGFIYEKLVTEGDGGFETFEVKYYFVEKLGLAWLQDHRDLLQVRDTKNTLAANQGFDEDIPF